MNRLLAARFITAAVGVLTLLSTLQSSHAQSINIPLCRVGNAGNKPDPSTGSVCGAVDYTYYIGIYDVAISQYCAFLNDVAKSDPYELYNGNMFDMGNAAGTIYVAGIIQSGSSGSFSYSVIPGSENDPVTQISWFDAARFCNWLQNGQPVTGVENAGTTENGAYALNGDMTSGTETAVAGAIWRLPTENEWYKAAFYDPLLNGTGGYWTYATQRNSAPGNEVGSQSNEANYFTNFYSVTRSRTLDAEQNYLTQVGSFTHSASHYGTYDQNGDVYQWNDAIFSGIYRGLRGGDWSGNSNKLMSSDREETHPPGEFSSSIGFRVESVLPPPTPVISSTLNATGVDSLEFRYQITASNYPTNFNATGLPKGLSVNKLTGLISGIPSVTGTFATNISAINLGGTDTEILTLTLLPAPPAITSPSTAVATNGLPFNYQITARHSPVSFNATGLPTGLSVNPSTGLISGTVDLNGKFAVTISAINTGGTGSRTMALTVDFNGVRGSYEGTAVAGGVNTGLFTLSLTPRGAFSAKLTLAGAHYPFAGTLNSDGTFSGMISVGTDALVVALSLDTTVPDISGTITAATPAGGVTYDVESSLVGAFKASTLPAGLAGFYTVVFPAASGTDPTVPAGPGYGAMTVANSGAVNIAGKLADGTSFSAAGKLDANGQTWTLFELLYAGKNPGSLAGTMTFENLGNSDCDGTLDWIKPPQTTGYYSGGFSTTVELMAAKYASPPLTSGSGIVTVGGGDLPASAINDSLMISSGNKMTVSGTNGLSVALTPATGAFSGHFLYPGGKKRTSFGGVIYQKPAPAAGYGLFLGPDQSGGVKITQ